MGQQQLLLIVVGIIIVGIAVIIGINIYHANSIETNRNNVTNELVNLAADAQKYFRKPREYGGGSNSFIGWSVPRQLANTSSGSFEIDGEILDDEINIFGTGTEVITDNDTVKVDIKVLPNNYNVTIIN